MQTKYENKAKKAKAKPKADKTITISCGRESFAVPETMMEHFIREACAKRWGPGTLSKRSPRRYEWTSAA